jgi:hypothetical protein
MKKSNLILLCILTTIVLGGCAQKNPVSENPITETPTQTEAQQTAQEFRSENLGVKFKYANDLEDKAIEQGSRILYPEWSQEMYIGVFEKAENESIQEAIAKLASFSDSCKVVEKGEYYANPKFTVYTIELSNPEISYSAEELAAIKQADLDAAKDGGPFNGEYKKSEIYNQKVAENCSEYGTQLGLGTSKQITSKFLYSEELSKTKFIFLPSSPDSYFHEEGSIEFL